MPELLQTAWKSWIFNSSRTNVQEKWDAFSIATLKICRLAQRLLIMSGHFTGFTKIQSRGIKEKRSLSKIDRLARVRKRDWNICCASTFYNRVGGAW